MIYPSIFGVVKNPAFLATSRSATPCAPISIAPSRHPGDTEAEGRRHERAFMPRRP